MSEEFIDKKELKESHKVLNFIIILFLLGIALFLYSRYLGTTGIIVKEYKVSNKIIPTNFDGVKIIHFSDIHYGNTTFMKDIKKIVDKINTLKPDLIFFTGDLIDEQYEISNKDKEKLTNYLSKLDSNLGKYTVKGEEDIVNEDFEIIMKNAGFTILDNSYDLIYNEGLMPIYLGGTSDSLKSTMDLNKTFLYYKNIDKKNIYTPQYKIILTHEGDNATEIMEYDNSTNLILAGHSHNGQIVLPFYGGVYLPEGSKKYSAPHYEIGNTNIYVSSGIGTSKFMYRFNNRPSINLYRLDSK